MATEEIISTNERNNSPTNEPLAQSTDQTSYPTNGYEELIRQYGYAMARIGQLEAQIGSLYPDVNIGEEAESGAEVSDESSSQKVFYKSAPGLNHESEEVAQLRMKVASLTRQLANVEEELQKSQGMKIRRRSRSRRAHGSKMRFLRTWARQLNFISL